MSVEILLTSSNGPKCEPPHIKKLSNLDEHNSIGSHWLAIFASRSKPFMDHFDIFKMNDFPSVC